MEAAIPNPSAVSARPEHDGNRLGAHAVGSLAATGQDRIAAAFASARSAGRGALVPYLCAGDPDLETTEALLVALGGAGADLIELGIPYGDPLADGPSIAAAAQRALAAGTTIASALACAARARRAGAPPMIAFTYVNPVVQYGVERFADQLRDAGLCGAVVPDVPLEETDMVNEAFVPRGLALPLLIAPTTPLPRAQLIAARSRGFTYLVSRVGVTGAGRGPDFDWVAARTEQLRAASEVPVAVGFGISSPDHVRRISALADGAIVGSALVDAYAGTRGEDAVRRVVAFVRALRAATG